MKIPFPIPEEIKTWKKYQKALSIIERLKQNGFQAFFVGGTVRDMVLKKDINELKDLDIASSAKPEEIGKIFRRCKKVGAKFGVMIVYMGRDFFEVATFRKDEEYDGRRPKRVVYVDAKEDVLRRDFTINGLLLDPFEEVIYDYVNGMKDIENKLVRAIGDPIERFQEDHLRMLRAIRFSCQLNFKIHPNTYSAIIQKAAKILEISKERIKEEFWKIFNSPFPEEGLFHLFQTGLIKYILPEAYSIWAGKEEEFKEFAKSLKNSKEPALFLALLLKDYAWKRTFSLLRERFRVDNETAKKVEEILKLHPQYLQNGSLPVWKEKKLIRNPNFPLHLQYLELFQPEMGKYFRKKKSNYTHEDLFPPRIITGNDLENLGLPKGPLYSEILEKIENHQLEGKIRAKDEALKWIQDHYLKNGRDLKKE